MSTPVSSLWKTLGAKLHWHVNRVGIRHPSWLSLLGLPLTVVDQFGTPGDTLLTGIICHELKTRHPRLRLHCITPNPSLLEHHPALDALNGPRTFFSIAFQYLGILARKDGETNPHQPTFDQLGIKSYAYRARLYLTREELDEAESHLPPSPRPLVTINVMSREKVKIWPHESWRTLVAELQKFATVIQLGTDDEPAFEGVTRLAGRLNMRLSAAVIARADLHLGGVSFLMHAARGVNTPAVIIYGGRETPKNSGYAENRNLYTALECSPCWLHTSRGDQCPYEIKCMTLITPDRVLAAVKESLRPAPPLSVYIPCFNNQPTLATVFESLRSRFPAGMDDFFFIDDGSTDRSAALAESLCQESGRVIRHGRNLGRGAARARAMREARHDLVLSCDATNAPSPEFLSKALPWFDDPNVAAVSGRLVEPNRQKTANRWRARHLFKCDTPLELSRKASLITACTVLRKSLCQAVGGYNPALRHSEDRDLGERLLAAGYDIVFDPAIEITPLGTNTFWQVLERYWRWHAGVSEPLSLKSYAKQIVYSVKVMAAADLAARDPLCVPISLLSPHYQFWKSAWRRVSRQSQSKARAPSKE